MHSISRCVVNSQAPIYVPDVGPVTSLSAPLGLRIAAGTQVLFGEPAFQRSAASQVLHQPFGRRSSRPRPLLLMDVWFGADVGGAQSGPALPEGISSVVPAPVPRRIVDHKSSE